MKNLSIILLFLVTVFGLNLNAGSFNECYNICKGACQAIWNPNRGTMEYACKK